MITGLHLPSRDLTACFRSLRFAETQLGIGARASDMTIPATTGVASSSGCPAFPSRPSERERSRILCSLCGGTIPLSLSDSDLPESELEEQCSRVCTDCTRRYRRARAVVKIHGAFHTHLVLVSRMLATLGRFSASLGRKESVDFSSEFAASAELHFQAQQGIELMERLLADLNNIALQPQSSGERKLALNVRLSLSQKIDRVRAQFRVLSQSVKGLRLSQAEALFLTTLLLVGELKQCPGVWAILDSHDMTGLVKTFKTELSQLAIEEAAVSWQAYSESLREKSAALPPSLMGISNLSKAFEGTVLRKAHKQLDKIEEQLFQKSLESVFPGTVEKLSKVLTFLRLEIVDC